MNHQDVHIKEPEADYGVIVGRFQVPDLHAAHRGLFELVLARHSRVLVILGIAPVSTVSDPLDYLTRKVMVQTTYPDVFVEGIRDIPGEDHKWSMQLDAIIRTALPHGTALLYGGRDSFIAHYDGTYPTAEVATTITDSGTQLRDEVRKGLPRTSQAREGVIWAAENRYPCGIATVDMIPYREGEILLGRRLNKDEWRMLGGFFDPNQDGSLESAAKRELHEEAPNLECDKPEYVGSFRVNDPRYEGSKDKIITALYAFRYLWGDARAGDDIAEVRWFSVNSLPKIASEHVQGIKMFLERPTA